MHLVCDNLATHRRPRYATGSPRTRRSACTSPRPVPPGANRENAGSVTLPTRCCAAGSTRACRRWRMTSAPGSSGGIQTQAVYVEEYGRGDPRLPREIYCADFRWITLVAWLSRLDCGLSVGSVVATPTNSG